MLRTLTSKTDLRRAAWVSADPLNVTPDLLGAPLAKPAKRAMAMGLDLLVIAILSQLDGFWLGAALVVFLYHMRAKENGKHSWLRNAWLWGMCGLCLWLAVERGWQAWTERHLNTETSASVPQAPAPLVPSSTPIATASEPASTAAQPAMPIPAASAPGASVAESASPAPDSALLAERIEALEEELAEARKPKPFRWQAELQVWWEGLGVGFGWAIAYFALVPSWLQGQSLGKKLLGLQVVELTGKPLTVRVCFSRYGGYVAGMATGGFGFAQILWDDNRQAIQDKVAHTVVIDLQAPYQLPTPTPDDAAETASQIGV